MPSKKCEAEGCNKWASFNQAGMKRPQYCRPHALPGMINVVSRQRCTFEGCTKQANFNHPGETRGLFCKAHIEEGMVDVRHKHCQHPNCTKQATCNNPGQPTGAFCGQHKLEGMVNVVLKRCQQEGCDTFPSFGVPGQPGVQYCRVHKLPGMVRRTAPNAANRQQEVDALNLDPTRCAHPGCGDCRPIYCFNHYQAHQNDPLGQMDEAQMQQYAEMQMHQQMHPQHEVHAGEHLQAEGSQQHVMGHQIGLGQEHHLHHQGLPHQPELAAYAYSAWHQAVAHNEIPQQEMSHEIPQGEHVEYHQRDMAGHDTSPHHAEQDNAAAVTADQQQLAYHIPAARSEGMEHQPASYSTEAVKNVDAEHHELQTQAIHSM